MIIVEYSPQDLLASNFTNPYVKIWLDDISLEFTFSTQLTNNQNIAIFMNALNSGERCEISCYISGIKHSIFCDNNSVRFGIEDRNKKNLMSVSVEINEQIIDIFNEFSVICKCSADNIKY